MSWQDRESRFQQHRGWRGGGFGGALRRVFGDGSNPLAWALPLFTVRLVAVRVHVVFVIYVLAELLHAGVRQGQVGVGYSAFAMGALFGLVLAHEFGHVLVCRRVGGDANEILMWPLGGLAMCMPPDRWRAHLATAAGGPLVNVLIVPITAAMLVLLTGSIGAAVFNPFVPGEALAHVRLPGGTSPTWLRLIWWVHFVNMVLLAFNVLVPMYPMDGGRIVQAILWGRMGYRSSMQVSVVIGLVAAGAMFVFGMVFNETMIAAIAIFGGITCWMERQRLQTVGPSGGGVDLSAAFEHPDAWRDEPAERPATRSKREPDPTEIDRILAKISSRGMGSLTRAERRLLRRASGSERRGR